MNLPIKNNCPNCDPTAEYICPDCFQATMDYGFIDLEPDYTNPFSDEAMDLELQELTNNGY